jgi:AcrR family transcriptional regulator
MVAIAARAGVARATLYTHYHTREALVAAVTQSAMAESRLAVDVAAPDEASRARRSCGP